MSDLQKSHPIRRYRSSSFPRPIAAPRCSSTSRENASFPACSLGSDQEQTYNQRRERLIPSMLFGVGPGTDLQPTQRTPHSQHALWGRTRNRPTTNAENASFPACSLGSDQEQTYNQRRERLIPSMLFGVGPGTDLQPTQRTPHSQHALWGRTRNRPTTNTENASFPACSLGSDQEQTYNQRRERLIPSMLFGVGPETDLHRSTENIRRLSCWFTE